MVGVLYQCCKAALSYFSLRSELPPEIKKIDLINCADLPRPKKLKPKAEIRLCDENLRANLRQKEPKAIKGFQAVYGFNTEYYAPLAFASNQHNEEQALYARVLANTIEPKPNELAACLDWCKREMRSLFPRMFSIQSIPFPVYIMRSNASRSVKAILRRTYEELQSAGLDENSHLSPKQLASFTTRSSFVKVENNLYQSPMGVNDKAPRLIQGATPQFICLVGPWVMACQDLLKRRWNIKNMMCFTSGISSEKLADYVENADGPIIEDDLGKFDCSIRKPWCEFEVWLCKKFGAPRAVLDLMWANIKTHGYTHHGWFYKCAGTRKSGDPYTSLMNSIINGLSHLYLYCKWTGKSVRDASSSIKMLLQGDDNLLRHRECVVFPWQEGMATLGFDSAAQYRSNLEEAEFCSNRLYPVWRTETERGYVFGPKPGKVLAKLGYIINPPKNVRPAVMMRGVALGLQKNCNHIPPLKVVIDRILSLTSTVVVTEKEQRAVSLYQAKFNDHTIKMRHCYESNVEVDLAIYNQYYWDQRMQSDFTVTVNLLRLGEAYADPFADLLFDRDTSAPQRIFNKLSWSPKVTLPDKSSVPSAFLEEVGSKWYLKHCGMIDYQPK